MRPGATSSIRNQNGNRWRAVHRLPRDQRRVVNKNPRSKHRWLSSSTTKASSIRNSFLQIKPLMPHFTRKFWTDCYSVSGGFSQGCTGLENWCFSTIMSLHTVRSVSANSWLRRWELYLITLLTSRSISYALLPVSLLVGGYQIIMLFGHDCHQRSVTAVLRSIPQEAFADCFRNLYERCQTFFFHCYLETLQHLGHIASRIFGCIPEGCVFLLLCVVNVSIVKFTELISWYIYEFDE